MKIGQRDFILNVRVGNGGCPTAGSDDVPVVSVSTMTMAAEEDEEEVEVEEGEEGADVEE